MNHGKFRAGISDPFKRLPCSAEANCAFGAPVQQSASSSFIRDADVNPTDEFRDLILLFPEGDALFGRAEYIPAALTPEPYKPLLVHDRHMTVAMEEFHRSPVVVEVLDRKLERNIYSRKILLKRSDDDAVVQFAVMRFDLDMVLPAVRDEILSERTPLGRILINYNVFRSVDLGAIFRVTAGPAFARLCGCAVGEVTYARLATIFCNHQPAVDLLEAAAPIEWPS
jgi:hypothetical protein